MANQQSVAPERLHMITHVETTQHGVQPEVVVAPPRVKDYLIFNIFMMFFFWPVALVGIVYSSKCRQLRNVGDIEGAKEASKTAKNCGFWALGLCIFFLIIVIIAKLILPMICRTTFMLTLSNVFEDATESQQA